MSRLPLALLAALLLAGLFARDAWPPDETRAADVARAMTLGDGWHATSKTPAELREALGRLRAAADAAARPWSSLALSLRFVLGDELLRDGVPAVVDRLAEYKRLGLAHLMIDFRRDDLGRMLELLDLIATRVRPAVDAA